MSDEFMKSEFVADAVNSCLRAGKVPRNEDALFLDSRPLIDTLRTRVTEQDVAWLLNAMESGDGPAAGLCCSLLRRHMTRPEVVRRFEAHWDVASVYLKNRMMWRMLDIPDLAEAWHRKFLAFVFENWETFRDFNLTFFSDPHTALSSICSRIDDASFPDSKKWVYLCCLPEIVEDPNPAREILESARSSNKPMQREAADLLLEHFWPDATGAGPGRAARPIPQRSFSFLAEAALEHLRTKHVPSEQEADWLNRLPIVDALRKCVIEDDRAWILAILERDAGEVSGLCLSLLRNLDNQAEIQAFLRQRWESATPFLRSHLIWRILDDPALPSAWHERIFEFILENWEVFQLVSLKFLGTRETVVEQARKRIADPAFPASKKWAYLCRVPTVASDPAEAHALVKSGLDMNDAFTRKVAQSLLDRFYGQP